MNAEQKSVPFERIYQAIFWIILGVSIVIRLPYLSIERMWPDEALYAWYAKQMFVNPAFFLSKDIIEFHPPLFAALLNVGHFIFPPQEACRWVVLTINVLGVVGIYALGKKVRGDFLGCFAALALSFNFLYLNQSIHILIDGVFAVAVVFFFLVLLKDEGKHKFLIGLMACSLILLKWSGVLVIPFLIAYYGLVSPGASFLNRLRQGKVPIFLSFSTVVLFLAVHFIQWGYFLPDTSAVQGAYLVGPAWYYVVKMRSIVIGPFLIPFFVFGFLLACRRKNDPAFAIGLWLVIFFAAITLLPEKDLRYSVPALPFIILLGGLGIEQSLAFIIKNEQWRQAAKSAVLVLLALYFMMISPKIEKAMAFDAAQFTGFSEAGAFVRQALSKDPDTLVVAASLRAVRYYSDMGPKESRENLLLIPSNREEFIRRVKRAQGPVVVVVDYWERTQPNWTFPMTAETVKSFDELGFKNTQTIHKQITRLDGSSETIPVVWLFTLTPSSRHIQGGRL